MGIMAQRETKKNTEEIEKKITALQKYQEGMFGRLDNGYTLLKKFFLDKANKLNARLNETLEKNKAVMVEIDNKTKPLKVSLNETRDTLRKIVLENEKEMKRIAKELENFSKEIQRMKDDIQERTIDLEL
jgi:methyl-accepting chemotaxis protein